MLPKVAHYAGFQSYGDLAYPTLKPGRKELQTNTVWQETVRNGDSLNFYNNNNRYTTAYDKELSKTVEPVHYQDVLHVTKEQVERPLLAIGKMTVSGNATSRIRTYSANQRNEEPSGLHPKGVNLMHQTLTTLKKEPHSDFVTSHPHLRATSSIQGDRTGKVEDYEYCPTGTEHWKSTYMAGIKDPYAYAKATRPEWSLNKPPYSVKSGPLASDYKVQFGERGDKPIEKFSRTLPMPPVPVSDEALKLGSTQATHHIPGYTGHMPKTIVHPDRWNQSLGTDSRTTILKQNILENYQTRIPGYSGHRPRNAVNDRGNLREYCFSTAGETFC